MKRNFELEIFFLLNFYVGNDPYTHAKIKTIDFDEMIQFGQNTISQFGLKFLRYDMLQGNDYPTDTFLIFDMNGREIRASIWMNINDLTIGWENDGLMLETLDEPFYRELHDRLVEQLGIPKFDWKNHP